MKFLINAKILNKINFTKQLVLLLFCFNTAKAQEIIFTFTSNTTNSCTTSELASDGIYLYGVTKTGGLNPHGTLFKVKLDGTAFQNLYHFSSTTGSKPSKILLVGDTIFGITTEGGNHTFGTIYKIRNDGTNFTVLHHFGSLINDDGSTKSNLIYNNGVLFGASYFGGSNWDVFGSFKCGYIYKINTNGSNYSFVHEFDFNNSFNPKECLVSVNNNLYGACDGASSNLVNKFYSYNIISNNYNWPIGTFTFVSVGFRGITANQTNVYCLGYVPGSGGLMVNKFNAFSSVATNVFSFSLTTSQIIITDNLALNGKYLYGSCNAGISRLDTLGQNVTLISNYSINNKLLFDGNVAYGVSYNSLYPNGFIFKIDLLTVSIIEEAVSSDKNEIRLYPNPTINRVFVSFQNNDDRKLKLFILDVYGKTIYDHDFNNDEMEIQTNTLPDGVYFVIIKEGFEIKNSKKLVIKR